MSLAAFEQAITFLSRTDLIAAARQQPLPAGVTEILKVSSGDTEALLAAQESSRFSQEDVRHAAQFYVQQILFAPESDHYRILGVDPDDVEAKIKLHYRLLVRWLHPDKNSSDWEAVFSDRINRAWHALRTPDRRREYDAQLESFGRLPPDNSANNRELKPAQWHHPNTDERFLSSRAIKRLPVVMFSLLGVAAISALWWFSQLQPRVEAPLIVNVESEPMNIEPSAPVVLADQPDIVAAAVVPMEPILPAAENGQNAISQMGQEKIKPEVASSKGQITPTIVVDIKPATKQLPVMQDSGKPILSTARTTSVPVAAVSKKPAIENKPIAVKARLAPVVAGTDIKTARVTEPKSRTPTQRPPVVPIVAKAGNEKSEMPVIVATHSDSTNAEIIAANRYDAEVKKLLQQFSRVYADGNYFALHNLFTNDVNIIGAPSQRKVLHGYRQLFQTSQQRDIAIQNVTWLENDEKITVLANYQSNVLPLGENQAQSSHGNIRIVLRMENGQLKIIRLQSDAKNG